MRSRWIWRLLATPALVWLTLFFLVAFYAIVAVGMGNVTTLFEPVPHWNPLRLERRLPRRRRSRTCSRAASTFKVFVRTIWYVVAAMAISLAIGYPVAYYAARFAGPLARADPRPARPAVLDLVHHADVRVDEPARDRRLRGARARRALDRHAVQQARAARRHRLARRAEHHRDPRARLRLRAVLHPAAVRVARPPRPAADRGRARPRGSPARRLPPRDPAALAPGHPRRHGADRAADVRRLLHAGPDVRARPTRR